LPSLASRLETKVEGISAISIIFCIARPGATPVHRDARVIGAVEKLMGGGVGIIAAKIICPLIFADSEPEPAPGVGNEIG
jgi:hypothetical protein